MTNSPSQSGYTVPGLSTEDGARVAAMLQDRLNALTDLSLTLATLGASPQGTPGALVEQRSWDDYSLGRAGAAEHLAALDLVYSGVISDHRAVIDGVAEVDPVTQDMLIGQAGQLELFHWFIRAHLENSGGQLATGGATSERDAARSASG